MTSPVLHAGLAANITVDDTGRWWLLNPSDISSESRARSANSLGQCTECKVGDKVNVAFPVNGDVQLLSEAVSYQRIL